MLKAKIFDTILGLEIRMLDNQQYSCRYAVVEEKDQKLIIRSSKEWQGNLVEMIRDLPRQHPVALSLSGKGIVHKFIPVDASGDTKTLLAQAFPGIESKDFYFQQFILEASGLVGIIRKDILNDLLDKLAKSGLNILQVSLGAMASSRLWEMQERIGQVLNWDGHQLSFDNSGHITSYQFKVVAGLQEDDSASARMADTKPDSISPQSLVSYGAAMELFLHKEIVPARVDVPVITAALQDFITIRRLKHASLIYLFSLFALLMISFISYSYYNQLNATLTEQQGRMSSSAQELQQMEQNISGYKTDLHNMSWNGGYSYGRLLNDIGKTRSRQLSLKSVSFEGTEKQVNDPVFSSIRITGESDNLLAVNNWMFVLKQLDWVARVNLLNYQEQAETGQYSFTIQMYY